MPFVRLSLLKGKSPEYIQTLSNGIYRALVDSHEMAENDLFQTFEQLEPCTPLFDRHYGAGPRSDDFMIGGAISAAQMALGSAK